MGRPQMFLCSLFRVGMLAIAASSLSTLAAQDPGNAPPEPPGVFAGAPAPKPNVEKELERMTKRYGLSAAQQSRIRPILVEHQDKLSRLLRDRSIAPKDIASRLGDIHSQMVSNVAATLSPEQRAKYERDEVRKRDRDQLPNAPDGPPPPGGEGGPPPPEY